MRTAQVMVANAISSMFPTLESLQKPLQHKSDAVVFFEELKQLDTIVEYGLITIVEPPGTPPPGQPIMSDNLVYLAWYDRVEFMKMIWISCAGGRYDIRFFPDLNPMGI